LLGSIEFSGAHSKGENTMAEKREICTCTNCGNEAEMIVTCQLIEVKETPEIVRKKEKQTKKCTVCGNEADLIVDFDE
jgi:hypothetical protein